MKKKKSTKEKTVNFISVKINNFTQYACVEKNNIYLRKKMKGFLKNRPYTPPWVPLTSRRALPGSSVHTPGGVKLRDEPARRGPAHQRHQGASGQLLPHRTETQRDGHASPSPAHDRGLNTCALVPRTPLPPFTLPVPCSMCLIDRGDICKAPVARSYAASRRIAPCILLPTACGVPDYFNLLSETS